MYGTLSNPDGRSRIHCSEPNGSIRMHVVSPSFNPSRRKVVTISKDRTLFALSHCRVILRFNLDVFQVL